MSINIYPSIAKVKRNGVYENLPGFVQQSGNADIEAMIATKESDTLAQYPHPQGSYFILNDVLYQADIDIPVNGTIAVGTNCHVAVLANDVAKSENDVNNLKNAITELRKQLVFTADDISLGTINSTAITDATTKAITIAQSSTRCVIGPFKLSHSYIIDCDESKIKYKLYGYYVSPNRNAYSDLYATWQTVRHIVGTNEYLKKNGYYYLLCALKNDATITDKSVIADNLFFYEADDENPFGLAAAESYDNGKPFINARNLINRATAFISCDDDDVYCSFQGSGVKVAYQQQSIGSSSGVLAVKGVHLKPHESACFLISTPSGLPWLTATSFAEITSAVGINVERYSKEKQKMLTGESFSYTMGDHLGASQKGTTLASDVASGVPLTNNGANKYSHCPNIVVHNGYAYCCYQTDKTNAQESAPTTEIELAKINLADTTDIVYKTLASTSVTLGTLVFTGRPNNPRVLLDSTNGKLHIYFNGVVSERILAHYIYDIATGDVETTEVCRLSVDGITYDFNLTNFNTYIGIKKGIPTPDYEFVLSKLVSDGNGAYYTAMSSGAYAFAKTCLFKTTDLKTFELYDVLPIRCGADCEAVVEYYNGFIYGACRHYYSENTLTVWKYNVTHKLVVDFMQIPDCATRPTLFTFNSNLYLAHGLESRQCLEIFRMNKDYISASPRIVNAYASTALEYNDFYEYNSNLYLAIRTRLSNGSQIWFCNLGTLIN